MNTQINSKNNSNPIGPYSHAMKCQGEFLYVSGQIGVLKDGSFAGTDIAEQTKQALINIKQILAEADFTVNDLVKCTILLKDLNHFEIVNQIYESELDGNKPARATYEVVKLPKDALIEIEAIACK